MRDGIGLGFGSGRHGCGRGRGAVGRLAAGRPARGPDNRAGFVLAFVVFMLFSVSVAAATGYLVVRSEFGMAKNAMDGSEALVVARAGLERFIAEHPGALDLWIGGHTHTVAVGAPAGVR